MIALPRSSPAKLRVLELDLDNVDELVARAWIDLAFVGSWLSEEGRERLLSAVAYVD